MCIDEDVAGMICRARIRREQVAHLRLSDEELAALKAAASRADMSVSAFIRSLALEGAGKAPFLSPYDEALFQLLRQDLRSIGNCLDQLTRTLNIRGFVASVELAAAISDARAVATTVGAELSLMTKSASARRRGGRG